MANVYVVHYECIDYTNRIQNEIEGVFTTMALAEERAKEMYEFELAESKRMHKHAEFDEAPEDYRFASDYGDDFRVFIETYELNK